MKKIDKTKEPSPCLEFAAFREEFSAKLDGRLES